MFPRHSKCLEIQKSPLPVSDSIQKSVYLFLSSSKDNVYFLSESCLHHCRSYFQANHRIGCNYHPGIVENDWVQIRPNVWHYDRSYRKKSHPHPNAATQFPESEWAFLHLSSARKLPCGLKPWSYGKWITKNIEGRAFYFKKWKANYCVQNVFSSGPQRYIYYCFDFPHACLLWLHVVVNNRSVIWERAVTALHYSACDYNDLQLWFI